MGVDRHDLIGALDAFTAGVEREIDMAEVNGRTFVNDASVGIYGDAVSRPACRYAKVRTLLGTAAEVMGPSAEAPALDLVDDLGGASIVISSSFSCRTTPTRLIARWSAAPAGRLAAGSSGSSSSTYPATARALQGKRGARRV